MFPSPAVTLCGLLALLAGTSQVAGNVTTVAVVTTSMAPQIVNGTTAAPDTTGAAPPAVFNVSESCPFSRWGGSPRYCYECRWCPFRASSCCEMEDEVDVLKSVNVSGSSDWDCFITIVHFQQCGRCDPASNTYANQSRVRDALLYYAGGPQDWTIRPCQQACQYIYNQCKDASTLDGTPVVPSGWDVNMFCKDLPAESSPNNTCYNAGSRPAATVSVAVPMILMVVIALTTGGWL